MNLKTLLEVIPSDRIIYLTAGSGYWFGGTKGALSEVVPSFDCQFERRYQKETARLKMKIEELTKRRDTVGERLSNPNTIKREKDRCIKQVAKFEKQLGKLTPPVPLLDREVVETYERISEDALAIVVKGTEPGKVWTIIDEHRSVQINDDSAAQALAAEIIKILAKDYAYALQMPEDDARKRGRIRQTRETLTSPWAQTLALGLDVVGIADAVRRNPQAVIGGG